MKNTVEIRIGKQKPFKRIGGQVVRVVAIKPDREVNDYDSKEVKKAG